MIDDLLARIFFNQWTVFIIVSLVLLFVLFQRIGKLGVDLLPAHPDRRGGLAFIAATPRGFAPFAFADSCVAASK